jgi:hypothetical protein
LLSTLAQQVTRLSGLAMKQKPSVSAGYWQCYLVNLLPLPYARPQMF